MSKLEDLFNGSQYARLNTIKGGDKNFSVRKQSNIEENIRQENATDFFGNTYQSGFDVNQPTLSTTGFAKSPESQNSKYTGDIDGTATTENNAFDSYNRFANDSLRNSYSSKLVHKYLATDSTKQYKTQQAASAGVVLTYNV